MKAEPMVLVMLTAVGSLLLVAVRRTAVLDHAALALPLGAAVYSAVACLLVVLPVPFDPLVALVLAVAVSIGATGGAHRGGGLDLDARTILTVALWPIASGVLSAAAVLLRGTRVSPDSYEYLRVGGEAAAGELAMPFDVAVERQLLTGVLHELASIYQGPYLASLSPLFAISALCGLWWLFRRASPPRSVEPGDAWLAVAIVLAVASANRFLFHAFYVNSHLLVGVFLFIAAAVLSLVAGSRLPQPMTAVACVCIVPVVMARPEGPLLVATVLLPAVVTERIDRPWRRALVATFAGAVLIWWVLGLARLDDSGFPSPVAGSVATAAAVGAAFALSTRSARLRVDPRRMAWAVPLGASVAMVPIVLITGAGDLTDSMEATWQNAVLGEGLWGATLVGFVVLTLAATTRRVDEATLPMLVPVTSFVPVALLLAYVRGGGYRVGPGDSLNRMWMHVLLLAAGVVILALGVRTGEGPPGGQERHRAATDRT